MSQKSSIKSLFSTRSFFAIIKNSDSEATKKKCEWAHRIFLDWKMVRNALTVKNNEFTMIRGDIMDVPDHELAYALCRFIHEVRKKNGDNYPAETLYDIIICLQLYMAMYGKEVHLLEDEQFIPVRNTLDNRMKELSHSGIIAP